VGDYLLNSEGAYKMTSKREWIREVLLVAFGGAIMYGLIQFWGFLFDAQVQGFIK